MAVEITLKNSVNFDTKSDLTISQQAALNLLAVRLGRNSNQIQEETPLEGDIFPIRSDLLSRTYLTTSTEGGGVLTRVLRRFAPRAGAAYATDGDNYIFEQTILDSGTLVPVVGWEWPLRRNFQAKKIIKI